MATFVMRNGSHIRLTALKLEEKESLRRLVNQGEAVYPTACIMKNGKKKGI